MFSNHRHTCVADRAKKAAAILCKGGVSFHFRAHDLRRTAASCMGEAGVDRFHIAHVLNHRSVTHSTVTAIYDRYRYDKEKRAALEKWAEVLSGIVEVKPAPTTAPAKRTQRQNVYATSSRGPSDVPAIRHERRSVAHLRSLRSNSRVMRKPAQGRGSPQGDPEWNYGNAYVTIAMLTVLEFLERDGASPFGHWFAALDAIAAAKITTAVRRLELGNFSNVKGVGAGVFEYRIDFGPGYRIYFGKDGDALVILLGGGRKSARIETSQRRKCGGRTTRSASRRT